MTGRERLGGAIAIGAMIAVLVLGLTWLAGGFGSQDPQDLTRAGSTTQDSLTGMGNLYQDQWTVTVTGAAPSGSGSQAGPGGGVEGLLYGVHLDYGSGITTTTDVTLTVGSPEMTVFVKSDNATDGWFYPSVQLTGSTGSAVSGAYERFAVQGSLTAAVGQSSTGTLTVTVLWGK